MDFLLQVIVFANLLVLNRNAFGQQTNDEDELVDFTDMLRFQASSSKMKSGIHEDDVQKLIGLLQRAAYEHGTVICISTTICTLVFAYMCVQAHTVRKTEPMGEHQPENKSGQQSLEVERMKCSVRDIKKSQVYSGGPLKDKPMLPSTISVSQNPEILCPVTSPPEDICSLPIQASEDNSLVRVPRYGLHSIENTYYIDDKRAEQPHSQQHPVIKKKCDIQDKREVKHTISPILSSIIESVDSNCDAQVERLNTCGHVNDGDHASDIEDDDECSLLQQEITQIQQPAFDISYTVVSEPEVDGIESAPEEDGDESDSSIEVLEYDVE